MLSAIVAAARALPPSCDNSLSHDSAGSDSHPTNTTQQNQRTHHSSSGGHSNSHKRRHSAVSSHGNNNNKTEEGEETNPLPYVRISKRVHKTTSGHHSSSSADTEMIETMAIREIEPDRLLATKRIVNAFNAGDIESIKDIISESALDVCEVYFSNLHHVFIGRAALFSLWSSLFEAFPNGIFRTSDSVINEKKQVFTSFLFFGTKIFPLLIDGLPLEILTTSPATVAANLGGSGMTGSSSSSDKRASSSGDKKTSIPQQHTLPSPSVKVDRTQPLFTTAELLLVDNLPEFIFEGRIVLHLNEHCQIRKFDFAWNRKM